MKFGKTDREVEVNIATRDALFRTIQDRLKNRTGFALATLNLDHLTKLPVDDRFLSAYRTHDLVVADGSPIIWLSQLAGKPLELMPGSDLIIPLCKLCRDAGVPIALIGSSDGALNGAARALKTQVPSLEVAFINAPPYGFDPEGTDAVEILNDLGKSGAGVCFIALGAPKQELFAAHGRKITPQVGFASIGAGLDFLSGHQVRAPKIMRMFALEWLWRAAQSPRRMVPRYAKCFAILPALALQVFKQR